LDEDKELNPNGAYSGARDEEAALASGVRSVQATRYKTITAIGSTEGADRKFPFSAVFDPLQRIVSSSLSSAPFALKPG
jgi:hypothetical protein